MKNLDTSRVEESNKEIFNNIRNYLAGRLIGATRDRSLLDEVVKCFYCKNYIVSHNKAKQTPSDPIELSKFYREIFRSIKKQLAFVFSSKDEIQVDPTSISFIDSELSKIDFENHNRDPFGDLYEIFVGTGIREEEGQFFTPQNGIELLVSIIDPKKGEKIIDPAAGAGGFLSSALHHLIDKNVSPKQALENLYGVEKDNYLAKLAATRLSMTSLNQANILCGDSLSWRMEKNKQILYPKENFYDVVLTNPPFGKNIVAASKEMQSTFDLGYQWGYDKLDQVYYKKESLQKSIPPQVLFVEKCLTLLKDGGRLGMVVPESLITSKTYAYVVDYLRRQGEIECVMGMPEDFFKTSGKGGTHTKVCLITFRKKTPISNRTSIFMAEAKWCGHDSRGRIIAHDDLPVIYKNYLNNKKNKLTPSILGYTVKGSEIDCNILSPRYYNPELKKSLNNIRETHDIVRLGSLVDNKVIEIRTGNEVGKLAYGTGNIPFVRTSDLSSWEVKLDPKHGVSEEIYNGLKDKQDVKENDILMVKDGTYLIGTCAIVTKYDTKIIYQSHLYKIRVLEPEVISPFLLLAVLSSEPVQQQIKSKRFTQDIIDSLGNRINDLILPLPRDKRTRTEIDNIVEKSIIDRVEARELAREACLAVTRNFKKAHLPDLSAV